MYLQRTLDQASGVPRLHSKPAQMSRSTVNKKNISKTPPRGSAVSWCANMQIHFSNGMS